MAWGYTECGHWGNAVDKLSCWSLSNYLTLSFRLVINLPADMGNGTFNSGHITLVAFPLDIQRLYKGLLDTLA